jgi:hypothetical protein
MGSMYSLLVAVGNIPSLFLALAAELAAALALAADDEELWCQLPTIPPTTAPMIIRIRRGIPTLIPVLTPFFDGGRPAI